jgi:hypothetical protein
MVLLKTCKKKPGAFTPGFFVVSRQSSGNAGCLAFEHLIVIL